MMVRLGFCLVCCGALTVGCAVPALDTTLGEREVGGNGGESSLGTSDSSVNHTEGGMSASTGGTGGTSAIGGNKATGGTGGASATGGTKAAGGTGGTSAIGGNKATGGTGGASATGGTKAAGGTGGASAIGGTSATGGTKAAGGTTAITTAPSGCAGTITLSSVLREAAGFGGSVGLTWIDVKDITNLSLDGKSVTNLAGIECFTGLKTLSLSSCSLNATTAPSVLTKISALTWLEELDLSGNQIENFAPIGTLTNLLVLNVESNFLSGNATSLAVVSSLKKLQRLQASSAYVESVTGLKDHPTLQWVDLSGNYLTNISELGTLSNLKTLDLGSNSVASTAGLEKLAALEDLSLRNQGSAGATLTLSPIKDLSNLTRLDIAGNLGINTAGLEVVTSLTYVDANMCDLTTSMPFTNLTNLVELNVSTNSLTEVAGLAKLTKLTKLYLMYMDTTVDISGLVTNANAGGFGSSDTLYLNSTTVTNCADVTVLESKGVGISHGKNCY
jgi:Leucine-rich repeat (LRR) protein